MGFRIVTDRISYVVYWWAWTEKEKQEIKGTESKDTKKGEKIEKETKRRETYSTIETVVWNYRTCKK